MRERTIEQYLQEMNATQEERKAALLWVSEGNDIESNPFFIYNENSSTMDFLSALRIVTKQRSEHLYS